MIGKSWARDAAQEITDLCIGFQHEEDVIAKVIIEHCPFKQDVAYMLMPRCKTCRHWLPTTGDVTGECLRPYDQLTAKVWASMYDGIHTQPDFGCVQWEAKDV